MDAFEAAANFQLEVLNRKPSITTMQSDIRMNRLKIRTYVGDVFSLNMAGASFIEALWSLIKLEEYVHQTARLLPKKEHEVFYRLMRQYREKLQDELNRVDMRLPHIKAKHIKDTPISLEIYRDHTTKKKRLH
jgi:hypothetical protein